ncbi:MAG: AMP-binding protein [Chloroflexota bacterium]|nr:AMP-binding protein [Chloroflexota bacterium]
MDLDPRPQDAVDLLRRVVRSCRRRRAWKVADSTGAELSGVDVLARALVLRRLLRRLALGTNERRGGVLLPPMAAAVVTDLALALDRRVIVNLNYSLSPELLDPCIAQADIRHVVTSRKFIERLGVSPGAEVVYLEDLRAEPTMLDKAIAAVRAALPAGLLLWMLGLHRADADDIMSVLFTSGTTGEPKGVMLTYANVAHNVAAVEAVIRLRSSDVLIGAGGHGTSSHGVGRAAQ